MNIVVEVPLASGRLDGEQQMKPGDIVINISNEVPPVSGRPEREQRVQSSDVAINIANEIPPVSSRPEREQQVQSGDVTINIPKKAALSSGRAEGEQRMQSGKLTINTANSVPPASTRPEGDQQVQPSNIAINIANGLTCGGDTALHTAACSGQLEVVKGIIKNNISLLLMVNNKEETPLHYAAQAGKSDAVDLFIRLMQEKFPDKNPFTEEGTDFLTALLRRKNQDGETTLYQAVHNKHLEVVKKLVTADPDLASIPDNNNVSPLYLAAMRESTDIVSFLIESFRGKVSLEAYMGPAGQTALHAAAFKQKGASAVQIILNWKPDLTQATDDRGSTPLHYAVSVNNMDAVELLLEKDRSSACVADSSGLFPVHVASNLGYLKAVARLLEVCPDSDQLLDAQGKNFFHIAVEEKKVHLVRWVCNNSKLARATNAKDHEGNTPMHLAVKTGHMKIFACLLKSKMVDTGVMNEKGLTPLDLAAAQKRTGPFNWQNQDYIIYRTLKEMRSYEGVKRRDHFLREYELKMDRLKIEKEAENYESMAKNLSIGSVLIASASSAGAFTVSAAYKNDVLGGYNSFVSRVVFKAFLTMVSFSFISSIMATGLLIAAALTYLDPKYRKRNLLICVWLVLVGLKGFIVAFSFGIYVVLRPVSHSFAFGIATFVIILPILYEQHFWPNIFVVWPLMRLILWKEFMRTIHTMIDHNRTYGPFRFSFLWKKV